MTREHLPHPLADEDIITDELSFDVSPDTMLIPVGSGWNSAAYRLGEDGDQVLKVTSQALERANAAKLHLTMADEYELLTEYHGNRLPPTTYMTVPSRLTPSKSRIVTIQPFVEGTPLVEYLGDPEADVTNTLEFYLKALLMYSREGKIADLANIEQRFQASRNNNVLITDGVNNERAPMLVDVNFGKTQRSELLGSLWTRLIAHGVKKLVKQMDKKIS